MNLFGKALLATLVIGTVGGLSARKRHHRNFVYVPVVHQTVRFVKASTRLPKRVVKHLVYPTFARSVYMVRPVLRSAVYASMSFARPSVGFGFNFGGF